MKTNHPRYMAVAGLLLVLVTAAPARATMLEARGLIKARHRTVLSSEIVGRVTAIPFRAGARFKKGAELVRLDCSLLEAERDKAAGGLKAARAQLNFHRELEKLQSIGALEVALDQARLEQRQAQWRIASLSTARCSIRAPYAGKVVQTIVNAHQSVRAQDELIEIVAIGTFEIEVMAPSTWLSWLKPESRFRVVIDETGDAFPARVAAIGAAVEPVSKMVLLRGRLEKTASSLVPGMGAVAYFEKR